MNAAEALRLCRITKGFCPAMALDEYTPEAWALALTKESYDDAEAAVVELAREQPFIAVSDIVARVKRIRNNRVRAFGQLPDPPSELDEAGYQRWLYDTMRAIADGRLTREQADQQERELAASRPARDVAALGLAGRGVDE